MRPSQHICSGKPHGGLRAPHALCIVCAYTSGVMSCPFSSCRSCTLRSKTRVSVLADASWSDRSYSRRRNSSHLASSAPEQGRFGVVQQAGIAYVRFGLQWVCCNSLPFRPACHPAALRAEVGFSTASAFAQATALQDGGAGSPAVCCRLPRSGLPRAGRLTADANALWHAAFRPPGCDQFTLKPHAWPPHAYWRVQPFRSRKAALPSLTNVPSCPVG